MGYEGGKKVIIRCQFVFFFIYQLHIWSGLPDNKGFFLFGVKSNKIVRDRLLHKKLAKIFIRD